MPRQPNQRSDRPTRDRPATSSSTTNSPGARTFADFKIIIDRNIFDTTRTPRSALPRRETRRPARVDSFTLVGTLSSKKGQYAFFDGSSPEYRKVLETGLSIADFKVAAITPDSVTLQRGTNTLELVVGTQVRREGSEWHTDESRSIASRSSSASDGGSTSSSATSGDESDVLKRLMKQREEELK
jgi:hypothetical protein